MLLLSGKENRACCSLDCSLHHISIRRTHTASQAGSQLLFIYIIDYKLSSCVPTLYIISVSLVAETIIFANAFNES